MSDYRLSERFCAQFARRGIFQLAIVCLCFAPVGVAILLYNQANADPQFFRLGVSVGLPLFVALISFSAAMRYFRTRNGLRDFLVTLERDELTRNGPGLVDLTIYQDQVTEIVETPDAGLTVRTADHGRSIFIPVGLVGYEQVRGILAGWSEIHVRPARILAAWLRSLAILELIVIAVLALILSMDVRVVAPAAAFLIGVAGWCAWSIQQNPHLDARIKRVGWMLVFPLIPVFLKLALVFGFLQP